MKCLISLVLLIPCYVLAVGEIDKNTNESNIINLPETWQYTAPLISPEKRSENPSHAQKDPTVVFYEGRWHVFMTIKLQGRSIIEHCSFADWKDADKSKRTILNGKMWRLWTDIEDFPNGFHDCQLALQAKIFEASHTYKLKGMDKYLTVIEENGRRYYKAYIADTLDGEWRPIADTAQRPFAGWNNVKPAKGVKTWTDNISHGELIRDGYDERLIVDLENLRFIFQGMWDKDKAGKGYGGFQWRIGMLTPAND